jgi:DNA-binding response OmpR family regulator
LILIVEDFIDAREMYTVCLEFAGFRVAPASDAIRGLKLAEELRPDLILMDAGLPGMSGWDAIETLKSTPSTRGIPVLMLTGHVLMDSRERAIAAGADGFLPKPCLPDELVREIRIVLQRPELAEAMEPAAAREASEDAMKASDARMQKGRVKPARRKRPPS